MAMTTEQYYMERMDLHDRAVEIYQLVKGVDAYEWFYDWYWQIQEDRNALSVYLSTEYERHLSIDFASRDGIRLANARRVAPRQNLTGTNTPTPEEASYRREARFVSNLSPEEKLDALLEKGSGRSQTKNRKST